MSDLVRYDSERVYEQAASHYLDLYDEHSKPPRLREVVDSLCGKHDEYDRAELLKLLKGSEWDDYLAQRRRQHLQHTLGARLMAAEWGLSLAKRASEILSERMDSLSDQQLIALLKVGNELAAKMDSEVAQVVEEHNAPKTQVNNFYGQIPESRLRDIAEQALRRNVKQARSDEGETN